MKKNHFFAGLALLFCGMAATAQQTEPATPTSTNPTVEAINSKYHSVEMPEARPIEKVFPVLGVYQSGSNNTVVKISLDEESKSIIWIEGLPQGVVKAILLKSPASYKIPAQKTATGNEVPEGTLMYNKEDNTLHICIGKKFDFLNPGSVFEGNAETEQVVKSAKGSKAAQSTLWVFTGKKQEVAATAINTPQ
ncbi:MAG: hypothetical protein GC171_13100 [Terrimonas sp.]|nr:hypothetical protein [Terrimonas sp.]